MDRREALAAIGGGLLTVAAGCSQNATEPEANATDTAESEDRSLRSNRTGPDESGELSTEEMQVCEEPCKVSMWNAESEQELTTTVRSERLGSDEYSFESTVTLGTEERVEFTEATPTADEYQITVAVPSTDLQDQTQFTAAPDRGLSVGVSLDDISFTDIAISLSPEVDTQTCSW